MYEGEEGKKKGRETPGAEDCRAPRKFSTKLVLVIRELLLVSFLSKVPERLTLCFAFTISKSSFSASVGEAPG